MGSDGVGWGAVGWGGGMLTFPRPRSLNLAQDVDTTLTIFKESVKEDDDHTSDVAVVVVDDDDDDDDGDDDDDDDDGGDDDDDDDVDDSDDDNGPVELFQKRGKWWELIV